MKDIQLHRMQNDLGFIAALDQSGGSTPKALAAYGVGADQYQGDAEMFQLVHQMRSRIMTSPVFTKEHILGAILFEDTMERQVDGQLTSDYLWEGKGILPFLKIDKGLAEEKQDVQEMKDIPKLSDLLEKANQHHIFGTKERSVIKLANPSGIRSVVRQQFDLAKEVYAAGLIPIIEPEVDITSPEKQAAEEILRQELIEQLNKETGDLQVVFKLSIPTTDNFYTPLQNHSRVLRIVALSGGYTQADACEKLSQNNGMIASFSRALAQDLRVSQSSAEFDSVLGKAIEKIYKASIK